MGFIFNRGRSKTAHAYPETRAGANSPPAPLAFARNFAKGPGTEVSQPVLAAGTQVQWGTIDSPGLNVQDVPITPRSTGVILVSGVVSVNNDSNNTDVVTVQVQVDDVTVTTPAVQQSTGEGGEGGFNAIPFNIEIPGLVIGTQVNIQVLVTAQADGEISLNDNDTTVNVQEVAVATG